MSILKRNSEAVIFLSGENSLLDASVTSINCSRDDDQVTVSIKALARPNATFKTLTLDFMRVIEYGFYYRNDYNFGTVERFKFLEIDRDKYYISLDPDEAIFGKSNKDQDFILSHSVQLIAI
ncbi:hypothetical protein OSH11_01530 [Kaistia dalseonensis]|uniref:Uncharacterized protein n=1 Tax=Kaistia dalseonensis TaxID=410840 RepID=A0ABU0H0U8_9HYPH|nr:hypothetical protein [Kaistia dalseonensis]MCX5493376.1 hypothetical protein [Kaistia dalseonensis]MDQ0435934.1 hypothetical protein [Kaistia dalseonensis]